MRETILQAALQLFDQYGTHNVSLDQIAATVGITTRHLTQYFTSIVSISNELHRQTGG